jgi:hypothetical protein
VLFRNLPDGVVLLSIDGGDPLFLGGPGALLWSLLAEPTGVEEAAVILADAHQADPEMVRADIEPLLDELARLGVVRASPSEDR